MICLVDLHRRRVWIEYVATYFHSLESSWQKTAPAAHRAAVFCFTNLSASVAQTDQLH